MFEEQEEMNKPVGESVLEKTPEERFAEQNTLDKFPSKVIFIKEE